MGGRAAARTLSGDAVGIFAGALHHSGLIQADAADQWGGKVVLVTLREGHSTTGTIKRMALPEK